MKRLFSVLALSVLMGNLSAQAQDRATQSWQARQVEITIPSVVTSGVAFPLIYRATPKDGVKCDETFQTKSKEGVIGQGRIVSASVTASRWIHKAIIDVPGYYLLTFRFKNGAGQVLSANARTKVVSASEKVTPFSGTTWDLPHKNLYFSLNASPSWSQTSEAKREILGLERVFFTRLLEQPDYDNSWYPQRAWNEMYEIFQPRFLPPSSFVRAFENSSYLPVKYVIYATWSQEGINFIYQAEIGEKAWIYIETPASKPKADLKAIFYPSLLKPPIQQSKPSANSRTLIARSLMRYRSISPEAPFEAVTIWLIQLEQQGGLNLYFPGYRAPEKPRIPSPTNSYAP